MNDPALFPYSQEGLDLVTQPGGYEAESMIDPVTTLSMSLRNEEVPLALADHILVAHANAHINEGVVMPGWEASLASLACDLFVRCQQLERRLANLL